MILMYNEGVMKVGKMIIRQSAGPGLDSGGLKMTEQAKDIYLTEEGDPQRLGARAVGDGINFAFAVPDGKEASLVIVGHAEDGNRKVRIPLPAEERTGDVSAVHVKCPPDISYYYEVAGKKVLDPYASEIEKGMCRITSECWDCGEDHFPGYSLSDLMIYKLHVKGFTRKAPKVRAKGTFAGIAEQIPYIKKLGFNAVEIMPLYEFDDTLKVQPFAELSRPAMRGADENRYSAAARRGAAAAAKEWPAGTGNAGEEPVRTAAAKEEPAGAGNAGEVPVQAGDIKRGSEEPAAAASAKPELSAALAVPKEASVLQETQAERGEPLPAGKQAFAASPVPVAKTFRNYWGYAEHNFYFAPRSAYASGSDAAAEVRRMVSALHREGIEVFMEMYFPENTDPFMALLAIRFWKSAYHMDGFHFIGAGVPVSSIVRSPLLTGTKLIFEQIDGYWIYDGSIPKKRNILTENDSFMHVARSFVKSDEGRASEFAGMIRRNPDRVGVINYAANVNGFTLYDTVCYNEKHNEQNGEDNADGTFLNYSWNCGTEGPSRKRNVRRLRIRQMKNLLVYTFLSQGVPLLYAGDECCNSQGGNNNAYASDDPVGWVDWSSTKDAEEMRSFVAKLAAFRKMHPVFHMEKEYRGTDYRSYGCPDLSFHDTKAWVTSFENNTRTLAVMYNGMYTSKEAREADDYFYVAYNAGWTEHRFALPDLPATCSWFPSVNTQLPAGSEFANEDAPVCEDQKYCVVAPRSVVILTGKTDKAREVKNGKTAKKRFP